MKIEKALKEKYKKLGAREFYSFNDPQVKAFITRGLDEGIEFLSKEYSEHHGFFLAPHRKDLTDVDIACIGIPMDTGAPLRSGSRAGPEAVKAWSREHDPIHPITKTIPFELCSIIDYGEVKFNSFEYSKRIDEIYEVYHRLNSANVTPLSVGGEHTITYPILKALGGEEPLGLIHLDAHADTFGTLGARINDGSHLRCAVVDGVLDPERTIQIGIRGRGSFMWDFSYNSGMHVITAETFQEKGADDIARKALEIVGKGPCYLSIDSDVFDPAYMPGTTMPEPFGLTSREVRDFLLGIRGTNLVGADLVEVCPAYDPTEISANLGSSLCFEMLCLLAEARVAQEGKKRKTHWG